MSRILRALRAMMLSGLLVYAGTAASAVISQVVIFGDSLGDAGNNAIVLGDITPVPIATPVFIPTFPYASGRYSNGPVWVEQFAASLGLSALPSLAGGTDFAFGGARVGPLGSGFPFSLLDQVDMFLSATGGVAPQDALYVVAGGGNDARDAFVVAALGGNPAPLIAAYAVNIATIITQLDAAGADRFVLSNVPDIGKTPAIRALGAPASALGSAVAMAMNEALAGVLAGFPSSLLDELFVFDTFEFVNDVFANPAAFGLLNVTDACAFDPACIASPGAHFWWDGIHPTTAAHGILAQAVLAQFEPIPAPATLALILQALVLLWSFRARRRR